MSPRRVAIGLGAGLAIVAGGIALGLWGANGFPTRISLDIDAAQLQAGLAGRFPKRTCAMMLACVRIDEPVVSLAEGSPRINLAADVVVSLGRRELPSRVRFSGVLRYVADEGNFYFDDLQVDELSLAGVPPELAEVLRTRAPGVLQRALEGHPVYTLPSDTFRNRLLRRSLTDLRVVDGRLRVTFGLFGL